MEETNDDTSRIVLKWIVENEKVEIEMTTERSTTSGSVDEGSQRKVSFNQKRLEEDVPALQEKLKRISFPGPSQFSMRDLTSSPSDAVRR